MTVDSRTWPLPRRSRTGPASSLDLSAQNQDTLTLAPPRGRIFPFHFNLTANSRRTVSTPLLIGPAILKRIFFSGGSTASPPIETVELGWSPNTVVEAGVALTVARPYTVLTELQSPFGNMAAASGQGFPIPTNPNTLIRWEFPVDLIVTELHFAFCVALVNNSINTGELTGYFSVLEAVNAEALAAYTGS